MRRSRSGIQVALLALSTAACGYFQAGSWEDDPKNWYRAFGESTPPGVIVTHSLYTRYPHFTHEHSFYLEFQADRQFVDGMISRFNLIRAAEGSTRERLIGEGPGIPSWFLPQPVSQYEVWIGMGTLRDAGLFVHKDTAAVYFTHTQL